MIATVDKVKCIGCTLCTGTADDIFEMDYDAGKAVVRTDVKIGSENKDRAKEAEQNCPVGAIKIKE